MYLVRSLRHMLFELQNADLTHRRRAAEEQPAFGDACAVSGTLHRLNGSDGESALFCIDCEVGLRAIDHRYSITDDRCRAECFTYPILLDRYSEYLVPESSPHSAGLTVLAVISPCADASDAHQWSSV
jgi:hypothetical protein